MPDHQDEDFTEQPSEAQSSPNDPIADDLAKVLTQPEGKRVIWWILEQCAVYRPGFRGSPDATNFRLGEQNIGLRLIAKLGDVSPSEYARLLLWNAQRAEQEKGKVHVLDAEE